MHESRNPNEKEMINGINNNSDFYNARDAALVGSNSLYAGFVGGYMTKKLVEIGEKRLLDKK